MGEVINLLEVLILCKIRHLYGAPIFDDALSDDRLVLVAGRVRVFLFCI